MTDKTVDYTSNSFGDSNPFDVRHNFVDPYAPAFKYNTNFVLLDTPALNDADSEKIMNREIYAAAAQPGNLLNDPILNRARANDPSVEKLFDDKLITGPNRKLLIERGTGKLYDNFENDPKVYKDYIEGQTDKRLYEEFLDRNVDNPNFKTEGNLHSDKFWLDDPKTLINKGNYHRIVPNKSMSKIEILNALTRFFVYLSILYILFARKIEFIYIPVIMILLIVVLYYVQNNDTKDMKREEFCRPSGCNPINICQKPTSGNPFMNVTMADLMDNRERPEGCVSTDKNIKQDIDKYFNNNLFRDVDDLFDRNTGQRQFYTTPITTIPNDQDSFAKWLYKLPETCKENQSNCLKYEDIRFNRFNPNIDRMERIKEDII
jgi:Family of unknown function (DUF5762)